MHTSRGIEKDSRLGVWIVQAELSIYRATVERLREEVDGLNERLAERSLAAESEQRQRQDLQISLKESEASKEKLMTELAAAGQANDRAAEGLRTSLEQELASVRYKRDISSSFPKGPIM